MQKKSEKGQILLIVVLIMVVGLTVGLSLAARTVTNIKIATDDENSQRAFSAAEAGIERLVKSDCTSECNLSSESFGKNSTVQGRISSIQGTSFMIKGGTEIRKDQGVDVWLSNYSTDVAQLYGSPQSGKVTVYWGDTANGCNNAALEIMVLSGNTSSPQMTRYAVDPCNARQGNNHFTLVGAGTGATISGRTFQFGYSINVSSGLLMRVIPFYFNTVLGVTGGTNAGQTVVFPIQGKQIETTGSSGGTVRKISFIQGYSSIPAEFFQYSLISP